MHNWIFWICWISTIKNILNQKLQMRRGKFSANFENAEFLAVSVVSIVSFCKWIRAPRTVWLFLSSDLHLREEDIPGLIAGLVFSILDVKKRIQIFLIVAVMGGFVVTECGRRKSKFLDIEMVFLIGPRVWRR